MISEVLQYNTVQATLTPTPTTSTNCSNKTLGKRRRSVFFVAFFLMGARSTQAAARRSDKTVTPAGMRSEGETALPEKKAAR
jgi:hypothetical protein